jgi:hypothetical protein
MNQALADELIAMKAADLRLRDELARDGSLFEGYHPRMEQVHKRNAARLREIVAQHGWPGYSLVGEEAADAAWMIVQHSIGEADFMRAMLDLFRREAARGEIKPKWVAMTEDRVRIFEGRPQLYGTNFDWDAHGVFSTGPIENPEHLDERRAGVGLPPFEEHDPPREEVPRQNWEERNCEYLEWTRKVGWRK